MFMKNFLTKNICFDFIVTIQKIYSFLMRLIKKLLVYKMKDESEGKIIDEFVGFKSKMHICSMKNTDGKESNAAKGVNIA